MFPNLVTLVRFEGVAHAGGAEVGVAEDVPIQAVDGGIGQEEAIGSGYSLWDQKQATKTLIDVRADYD